MNVFNMSSTLPLTSERQKGKHTIDLTFAGIMAFMTSL